jgi:Tol biopolymer transport system component
MKTKILAAVLCVAAAGAVRAEPTRTLVPKIRYRFITNEPGYFAFRPAFSPTGKSIVFEQNRIDPKSPIQLHLIGTGGENLRPLVPPDFGFESTRPAWSRQNGLIAFAAQGHGITGTLWIIRPDGTGLTQLTNPRLTTYLDYPHWYFKGSENSIVLVDYEKPGDSEAGVIKKVTFDPKNPAKTEVEAFTDPKTFLAGEPSLSPDGLHIAMAAQPNTGSNYDQGRNRIWILNAATKSLRKFDGKQGRAPTFSPNGKWITFESNRGSFGGQYYAIYAKSFPKGDRIYQLTPYSFNSQHNIWSDDGRYIMCSAQFAGAPGGGIIIFRVPKELRE